MSTEKQSSSTFTEFPSFRTLGVLVVLTVALGFFFLHTLVFFDAERKEVVAPKIVTEFFTNLVNCGNDVVAQKEVLRLYRDYSWCSNSVELDDAVIADQANFETILSPRIEGVRAHSCEITGVTDGVVEVLLKDADGNALYPRIGFIYKLDTSGYFIQDYTMGRLQPFSTKDKEYLKAWN